MALLKFFQEVKIESNRVSWPPFKEVWMVVALVLGAVALSGLFFLVVDTLVYKLVQLFLGV